MARKKRGRNLCGLMLLDKPRGLSSNQAMQQLRRLMDANKAGHGGALDPMAEGVLPILFGDATRLSQRALDGDKTYQFGMQFGARTDTGDADGQIVETCSAPIPTAEQIKAVIPQFLGPQQQIPPMYSALKRDGQPLYKLARKGEEVVREPRAITVHALQLDRCEDSRAWLSATVTKGTYVRTLAEDIATALGQCAHLFYLRRTMAAGLAEPLVTLDALGELTPAQRDAYLQPVDVLVPGLIKLVGDEQAIHQVRHGQPMDDPTGALPDEGAERLLLDTQGRVIAIVRGKQAQWWPVQVFAADAMQTPCGSAKNGA